VKYLFARPPRSGELGVADMNLHSSLNKSPEAQEKQVGLRSLVLEGVRPLMVLKIRSK
jgi:hypothetical protein